MNYIATILILITALLECLALPWVMLQPEILGEAIVVHIVLYVFLFRLLKGFLKRYPGVPDFLFLFLPGLGGILVGSLYLSLIYFKQGTGMLAEYERYINYDIAESFRRNIDYEQEVRTLSFKDQMSLLDTSEKKDLIINLGLENDHNRVKALQLGLMDEDLEIQHYSAVTLNMLENEHTAIINRLREEFNLHKDTDSLKRLLKAYRSYLDSKLLVGDVLQIFNKEYIEALKMYLDRNKRGAYILNELCQAYLRAGNYQKADEVNTELRMRFPDDSNILQNHLHIAYKHSNYITIKETINALPSKKKATAHSNESFSFWLEEGEAI